MPDMQQYGEFVTRRPFLVIILALLAAMPPCPAVSTCASPMITAIFSPMKTLSDGV